MSTTPPPQAQVSRLASRRTSFRCTCATCSPSSSIARRVVALCPPPARVDGGCERAAACRDLRQHLSRRALRWFDRQRDPCSRSTAASAATSPRSCPMMRVPRASASLHERRTFPGPTQVARTSQRRVGDARARPAARRARRSPSRGSGAPQRSTASNPSARERRAARRSARRRSRAARTPRRGAVAVPQPHAQPVSRATSFAVMWRSPYRQHRPHGLAEQHQRRPLRHRGAAGDVRYVEAMS